MRGLGFSSGLRSQTRRIIIIPKMKARKNEYNTTLSQCSCNKPYMNFFWKEQFKNYYQQKKLTVIQRNCMKK